MSTFGPIKIFYDDALPTLKITREAETQSNESKDGVLLAFSVLQGACPVHYAKHVKNTQLVKKPCSVIVSKVQLRRLNLNLRRRCSVDLAGFCRF